MDIVVVVVNVVGVVDVVVNVVIVNVVVLITRVAFVLDCVGIGIGRRGRVWRSGGGIESLTIDGKNCNPRDLTTEGVTYGRTLFRWLRNDRSPKPLE